MDKGNEEMKQDLQEIDARTLVTALTRQLNLAEHESSGLADTSVGLSHAMNDDTVLPVQGHSNTSIRASDFVSARPNDTFIYHDDDGGEPPLPEFLARSHIQMALHRAEALHTQRQLPDDSLSHVSPTFAARPASLREGGGEDPSLHLNPIHVSDLWVAFLQLMHPTHLLTYLLVSWPRPVPVFLTSLPQARSLNRS
jgi:hypothetical protein